MEVDTAVKSSAKPESPLATSRALPIADQKPAAPTTPDPMAGLLSRLGSAVQEGEKIKKGEPPPSVRAAADARGSDQTKLEAFMRQTLLQVGLRYEDLPEYVREALDRTAQETDPKKFTEQYQQMMGFLKSSVGSKLKPEDRDKLNKTMQAIAEGQMKPEELFGMLKGHVQSPEAKLTPAEQQQAQEVLEALEDQAGEVKKGMKINPEKIKGLFSLLLKILKIAGLALVAIFGMSFLKMIMGGGGGR